MSENNKKRKTASPSGSERDGKPLVYVALSADLLHPGHLNILRRASELGYVVVGMLTDRAIATYKRLPCLEFNQRKEVVESIKWVDEVIVQETLDYTTNLTRLKPQYVVHGTDWRQGIQKAVRERVLELLAEWGGQLVEPDYTEGISSSLLNEKMKEIGTTPRVRLHALRRLFSSKPLVRVIESHNGLTALLADHVSVTDESTGTFREFDALWCSSLTQSTVAGKPDTELVDSTTRLSSVSQMLEATTKPFIYDGDTGGKTEHFVYLVRTLERLGIGAVIIEDKVGPKRNSLFGTEADVPQQQDTIEGFTAKIRAGKASQIEPDFMIIARIESLILGQGESDALTRARAFAAAGADAIMIHSKAKEPAEVLSFCKAYGQLPVAERRPLVVVPSTYDTVYEAELQTAGVSCVIYANHLLRAAFPAMKSVMTSILTHGRAHECASQLMPIKQIISLIPNI